RGRGPGLNSGIAFETANKPSLGRSYTLQYVLLSEFALWPNFGIDLDEVLPGLYQAVPEMPGTIIIKESTAKGENAAKEFWDDTKNGYRKIFLSWLGDDSYRSSLALGETLDLCGAEEIGGQQTRYGNELEEARLIRRELEKWYPEETSGSTGTEWLDREILARLKWRRETIDKKCRGDKNLFRNEYPTIPAHAFAATSSNCFDQGSLELMREYVERESLEPIRLNFIADPDSPDAFAPAPYGRIQIYKLPEEGASYVIGGDPSRGMNQSSDPSALVILKVSGPDEISLEEIAGFNAIVPPEEFAEMAYHLGLRYNTALLAIEDNDRGGAVANSHLAKTFHYPRLYYPRDDYTGKRSKKPGFITNAINKSKLVADLAQIIRDRGILFRSPALLEQLAHYQELPNGTLGAPSGWHDDFASAALIAVHLSTKIHHFPPPPPPIRKDSFEAALRELDRKNRPRLLGRPL
ncbi:MAG TPA: hypothetical protein VJ302_16820, partial [Blastocatellia bacterium]|nr:hypothetical protein [Blastocatellia bacterium]